VEIDMFILQFMALNSLISIIPF